MIEDETREDGEITEPNLDELDEKKAKDPLALEDDLLDADDESLEKLIDDEEDEDEEEDSFDDPVE